MENLKIPNLAIVINTNSTYKDIWPMFFGQLSKYIQDKVKSYTFVDKTIDSISLTNTFFYNNSVSFRDQYLQCLEQVTDEYCLTLNDDYILYKDVDFDKLKYYISILGENKNYSFIRLLKGYDEFNIKYKDNLWVVPFYDKNLFSQVATIWRTKTLENIYKAGPPLHIGIKGKGFGQSFETAATQVCFSKGIEGLYTYNNEPKRGIVHYDSYDFPCIMTALVEGCWNLKEYPEELGSLLKEYKIDPNIRGIF